MAEEEEYQHLLLQNKEETKEPYSNEELPINVHWKWWLLVAICIIICLSGQILVTLISRLYYEKGGHSKWLMTLLQTAGFPILLLPMFFYKPSSPPLSTPTSDTISTQENQPSIQKLCFIYICFGLSTITQSILTSYAISLLPVSTYSLLSATQLAFNALFSYFINSEKLTPSVLNSVVLLTISASLVAMENASLKSAETLPVSESVIGIVCTITESAAFALSISMIQYCFDRILKQDSFSAVWEMQIYPAAIATCGSLVGLFVSCDVNNLQGEFEGFQLGKLSYVMLLVSIAVLLQVTSVASLLLVYEVSALFSNAVATMTLPLVPILGVVFFQEKFNGIKVAALILAVWGFLSYIYQQYLNEQNLKRAAKDDNETPSSSLITS